MRAFVLLVPVLGLQIQSEPRVPIGTKTLQSGLMAVSLAVVQLHPGTALALSAEDYNSMYESSATANEPSFSFSLPKAPVKKEPTPPKEVPKFEVPKVDLPKVDVPNIEVPKLPKIEAPDFPKLPSVEVPKAPSLPSLPSFGGDATDSPPRPVIDEGIPVDLDALDEEARATAKEFRRANADAKQAESTARALRKIANEKKQAAKEAKDAACEYRPGGKFLCIRGLNSGF
ncbi:hypothetical protein CTAYLR_002302 [Chrysophaeum taylorii]|uniref:Uncharacterized protein n=1 Tax=Chrysophaeum taylorii TaxID=2483200 RepID=A0AAD7UNT8_9STRA|nr:hypothetical protein CTAYLR_002302 [Chrysophaeum taylorii]